MSAAGHPQNHKFIIHFEQLRQEAIKCNNSNVAKGYAQVIVSLRKYPIPIVAISQAEMLHGVGSSHLSTFERLFGSMQGRRTSCEWRAELNVRVEHFAHEIGGLPVVPLKDAADEGEKPAAPKKRRKDENANSEYSPVIGSAAWACLLVLHVHADGLSALEDGILSVPELTARVQRMHEKYPKSVKFGKSTLKKLVEVGVLQYVGAPSADQVALTEQGRTSCAKIWSRSIQKEDLLSAGLGELVGLSSDRPNAGLVSKGSVSQLQGSTIDCAKPNGNIAPTVQYDLVMVMDTRETGLLELLHQGSGTSGPVTTEGRMLSVGDILWTWKSCRVVSEEYIAGWIVERKTIADLSQSIKDGRFEEQKLRLMKAPGIEKIVYIVEGVYEQYLMEMSAGLLPEKAIRTAIRLTQLMPGFTVIETKSMTDTAAVLVDIHKMIREKVSGRPLSQISQSTTFRDFASNTHKTNSVSVSQISAGMIRALPGVGEEASVKLHEYCKIIGLGGLTLGNVRSIVSKYSCNGESLSNLNEEIKRTLGAKRLPINANGLVSLKEQYG